MELLLGAKTGARLFGVFIRPFGQTHQLFDFSGSESDVTRLVADHRLEIAHRIGYLSLALQAFRIPVELHAADETPQSRREYHRDQQHRHEPKTDPQFPVLVSTDQSTP